MPLPPDKKIRRIRLDDCCRNPSGGLVQVKFGAWDWIDWEESPEIINQEGNWQSSLVFPVAIDRFWLIMPYLPNSFDWKERKVKDGNGHYYEQIVSGRIEALDQRAMVELEKMCHKKFILKVTDKQKRQSDREKWCWLLGSECSPVSMEWSKVTGSRGNDRKSYTVTFKGKTFAPARTYHPRF